MYNMLSALKVGEICNATMLYFVRADILFLETSALTGEGVEEVFIKVARMILNKIEDGRRLSSKPLLRLVPDVGCGGRYRASRSKFPSC